MIYVKVAMVVILGVRRLSGGRVGSPVHYARSEPGGLVLKKIIVPNLLYSNNFFTVAG
jgi:hypothetical protein